MAAEREAAALAAAEANAAEIAAVSRQLEQQCLIVADLQARPRLLGLPLCAGLLCRAGQPRRLHAALSGRRRPFMTQAETARAGAAEAAEVGRLPCSRVCSQTAALPCRAEPPIGPGRSGNPRLG